MKAKIFFVVDYGNEERREFAESEKDAAEEFFKRKMESRGENNKRLPVAFLREIRFSQIEVVDSNFEWDLSNKDKELE